MEPRQSISLQQAIDIAKKDPNSQFAVKLRSQIESGALDDAAAKQGVDLSRFGRPKTVVTQEDVLFGIATENAMPQSGVTGQTANTTAQQYSGPTAETGVVKGLGLEQATDVFGSALARQGIGTDVSTDITQQFIEKPTAAQLGGAALQTGATVAGVAAAPVSLPAQILVGAGLGYGYDVGANLVEGKTGTEAAMPGVGTAVGVAAPLAIGGAGRLFQAAYGSPVATQATSQLLPETAVTRAVKETPVPNAAAQTVEDITMRGSRAMQRGREFVESQAERSARIAAASEPVKQAIRANVDDVVIDIVQNADEQTKAIMRDMVNAAEVPKTGRVTDIRPTDYAGNVAVQQYGTILRGKQAVGRQIGELSDSLPAAQKIDNMPALRQLRDVLRQNDIVPMQGGKLRFDNPRYTTEQQSAIQELYDIATRKDVLSARQIHQLDQRFSAEQRKAQLVNKIGNVMVDTPDGTENIFALFRNTYRNRLDEIAPEMRQLNNQYRRFINMEEAMESSIVSNPELSDLVSNGGIDAEAGLRRIFGEGKGADKYGKIYQAMDEMSRELGYSGPRADELYYFGNRLRDIYPETIPETGLRKNISTSIRDVAGDVLDIGKVQPADKQAAIKAMLGITD